MKSCKLYINCTCSEDALIDVFNFLDSIMNNKYFPLSGSPFSPSFAFRLLEFEEGYYRKFFFRSANPLTEIKNFFHLNPGILNQTPIVLIVKIGDDTNLDVFSYRYLFLIMNKLLRKIDQVYLDCPDTYYHKVGSYFSLQPLFQSPVRLRRSDGKRLPQRFTLSPEWLPAIYLSNRKSDAYTALANPIFKDIEQLRAALQNRWNFSDKLDFTQNRPPEKKSIQEQYAFYLEQYFMGWIAEISIEPEITERLYSTPGIAQLLFALLCKKVWGNKKRVNRHMAKKILEISCDFGNCILQTAENIVSHTEGGVLSIRINDNWDKIKDAFQANGPEKIYWYMRISLVDFSQNSILDNVKKKSKINELMLSHIFDAQKAPQGISQNEYQQTAKKYKAYLDNSEQIILHYGLPVFCNTVNQYDGCFTIKSSVRDSVTADEWYVSESKKILYCGAKQDSSHLPGSEYDILLPLNEGLLDEKEQLSNPSILLKPKYIVSSPSKKVVFERDIWDHFNGPLTHLVLDITSNNSMGYQQQKEQVVIQSAQNLAAKLLADGPQKIQNSVFYFHLSDITERVFGRTEIIAKVILQTIAELKKYRPDDREWLCLVLYGLSESKLAQFTRQFALFYHRSEGNQLMQGCQLYMVSENYQTEVMFAGAKLSAISDYCWSRQLVTGTSSEIADLLAHIAGSEHFSSKALEDLKVFPFDLLYRMERVKQPEQEEEVILSPHNRWYCKNLETVLQNDIHGKDLGCCLQDAHIRVGGVHLSTFFEGQLLFGNLYWYQIFAHHICETVLADQRINKNNHILLYGYETYSEQMLFSAAQKLREKGRTVHYALFENPKYITATETSEQRVRYIEQLSEIDIQKLCIVYIYGIGTTLTTIGQKMNVQLESCFENRKKKLFDQAYKKGIVIVQISDKDHIQCNRENHTIFGPKDTLHFLTEKECNYLVEIQTKWYFTNECPHCLLSSSYLSERPLIQTNETSTVPMLLIKPKQQTASKIKFKQSGSYTKYFFQDPNSADYLYYSHLNRGENHYQFYIRTASLLNRYLFENKSNHLDRWFNEIRKEEVESAQKDQVTQINILVSPQHFSNESLVAAVNERVFGGEAYVINFDVKKEFRDSFVAKFQNYRSALEILCQSNRKIKLELNFYFVDDIIVTGNTFNRAKSLVSSMLGEFAGMPDEEFPDISVNLFKGIILLVNRNSKQTMCNYFTRNSLKKDENGYLLLPVYAFIELNTPAIRSYGDSCPICKKVARIHTLERESSLTYVERHWRKKGVYHGLKKLSVAKEDKKRNDTEHSDDVFYRTRGLRRLQCSEEIWKLLQNGNLKKDTAQNALEDIINRHLCQMQRPEEQIEYLISYLKIITREHIVFQEFIQPAAFQILLRIFSIFIEESSTLKGELYQTVCTLIQNSEIPKFIYTLYQIIIARLCTMGSVVFCRSNELKICLEKGLALEEKAKAADGKSIEPFSEFLCIQIKKMLFITDDCAFRVEELQNILRACIKGELEQREALTSQKLKFFASMYLESVCNETRCAFLSTWKEDAADKVEAFRKCIETEDYSSLLDSFRKLMKANKAVMFQTKLQSDLTAKTEYRSITILASSQEETKRIDVLRSELLDFYRNNGPDSGRPFGQLLLDVKDTVRIVRVGQEQKDLSVQNYVRQPCTIAYVRLDYADHLHSDGVGRIFFAFFYPEEQSNELLEVLKFLQGFLSFRHNLKQRIEKDFNGNLFGKRAEESWRIDWLSIEKAGAHTDSSGVNRLISQCPSINSADILDTLFGFEKDGSKGSSQLLKLPYNILIAMYFRAVISDEHEQFISADNIEDKTYFRVGDLIQFSKNDFEGLRLRFGKDQNEQDINNAPLYGKPNTLQSRDGKSRYTGIPACKRITFRSKYLRAFLVDILCNIKTYGEKDECAQIYIEEHCSSPGYLVFQNQVAADSDDLEKWCREKNYELKQSIEFDHVKTSLPKGFSLGCIAHCMHWAGVMTASFSQENGKAYFTIKLPIIESRNEEGVLHG